MTEIDMGIDAKVAEDTLNLPTESMNEHVTQPEASNDSSKHRNSVISPPPGKDEYLVKTIDWKNKNARIITQNGKCRL